MQHTVVPNPLNPAEYEFEVREHAEELHLVVEQNDSWPLQEINELLDEHPWFSGEGLSGADYGAIIDDFNMFEGEVGQYKDPETVTKGGGVLRRMAFAQFEADVLEQYDAMYERDSISG